jgi:outer membrane protein assembly factor BamB
VPAATAIELDVSGSWEPPDRWAPRSPARRVLACGLVLLLLLAGLGAAQRRRTLTARYAIPTLGLREFNADETTLYVRRSLDGVAFTLDAYRLSDGRPRWRVPLRDEAALLPSGHGRVLLDDGDGVIALDAADGHEVWRRPASWFVMFTIGRVSEVLITENATDARVDRSVVGLDLQTGAVRWQAVIPAGAHHDFVFPAFGPGGERHVQVAQLDPDGTLTLRSGQSGAILRTVTLAAGAGTAEFLSIQGDWALTQGTAGAAVYDLRTGHRIWQGHAGTWCGIRLLCRGDRAGTIATDPLSGRELWRSTVVGSLDQVDGRRLLAIRSRYPDAGRADGAAVVDAASGRVLVDLSGWQIVDTSNWPRLLATRAADRGAGHLAWVDGYTGRVSVFGRLPALYRADRCQPAGDYLICRTETIRVWRTR